MCGICGKVDFSDSVVERSLLEAMCRTIVHRGPDQQGIHTGPHIGLAQQRLAIIDLRSEGVAPLANEDESIWVTFNGEIYNFQELRDDLSARGHQFRTRTDTEVIVHLYEEYGLDCLAHMRGMFAFALWDSRKQLLFAARDRLGKKPFIYAQTSGGLTFGSEIKAVLADPAVAREPNYAAIDLYLTYQYVPSPLTAFDGIHKLPPAHYLTCTAAGEVKVERYWSPPAPEKSSASPEELQRAIVDAMRDSVRLRMVADVPLGAFLSGGIDSGAVVALMAEQSSQKVKTFSIGFEDDSHNELPFARLVAERYGTEHHEFIVKPAAAEVLPLLVRHYDEPFADSSALPTYYVAKMTREHVTVALSGDGGDESFAGYTRYAAVKRWEQFDAIPRLLRRGIRGGTSLLASRFKGNTSARLGRAGAMLAGTLPERYLLQMTLLKPAERRACYSPEFVNLLRRQAGVDPLTRLPWNRSMDAVDWMMRHDQHYYLPDCLMVKSDIASMANSLELRCPLLDHKLVELAAQIPSSLKLTPAGGKQILRQAVAPLLPSEILNKSKTGFGIPLAKWLRDDLAPMMRTTLLELRSARRRLFEPMFMHKLVNEHISGRRDWSNRLWAFLFLELWFREYID